MAVSIHAILYLLIAALVFTPLPLGGGRTGAETDAREEYSVFRLGS